MKTTGNYSFYANEQDAQDVFAWLLDQPELAFILPDGYARWRAHRAVLPEQIINRRTWIWHVPSGPLPFWQQWNRRGGPYVFIDDPWHGWEALVNPEDPIPYLGPGPPNAFLVAISPTSSWFKPLGAPVNSRKVPAPPGMRIIGRSDFEFPGIRSKLSSAMKFWKKLGAFLYAKGVPIDPLGSDKPGNNPTPASVDGNWDFFALPGALAEMKSGTRWDPYPNWTYAPVDPSKPIEMSQTS